MQYINQNYIWLIYSFVYKAVKPFSYFLPLFYTMTYPNGFIYSAGFAYSKKWVYDLFSC